MTRAGKTRVLRLGLLVALLGGLLWWGRASGIAARLSPEYVRATVQQAGAWGAALYLGLFIVGELMQVPGWVFMAAGVYAFGRLVGGPLAFVGAVASVVVSFVVVRAVAGRQLHAVERPFVRRMLARLDERPVRTVVLLRVLLWVSPPLNYALAMTSMSFRDFLVGSAIGLVPPVVLVTILVDWFVR